MRILQLCNKPPYPPIDGGSKAMHNLTRGLLEQGHHVKVLCISTPKQGFDPKAVPEEHLKQTAMEAVFVDTSVNVVDAFTDLITADNYNISRFFSPDMDIRLIRLLSEETFDIVQLESLFMTPYIPTIRRYSKARVVLRSHNLEHVIQERIATGEKNILKRPYRKFLARQLHAYEMSILDKLDGVAAISPTDAEHFIAHGTHTPVMTAPFAVDPKDYPYEDDPIKGTPVFFHLGSMDWLPNEEGIRWLLTNVWPKVLKKHGKARLHLAGNQMPKDLLELDMERVRVNGRVKNALLYMNTRDVMLVPLFSAGGMRVKIIEGMALGKAIISTPVGAEGIDHTDGRNILIARNMTEFTEHILSLAAHPERIRELGSAARELITSSYSNTKVVQDLNAFYKRLIKA